MEGEQLLLRINEAAGRLAVGRSTVYQLIRDGDLTAIHVGRSVRVTTDSLRAWVSRRAADSIGSER